MATYWENSCSFGLRYVSWYKYLIVSLVFSHLGFWSGNLFLIAPFPDLCLLVPFYERLVGLVKRSFRKSLDRRMLTLIQLQTLLKEAEAVVNSRPLVYLGDDINSNISLTPGHFLSLNPKVGVPMMDEDSQDPDYTPRDTSAEAIVAVWNKDKKY